MEETLYNQLYAEVLASQKQRYPVLPEADLEQSAEQLIELAFRSAIQAIYVAKRITPLVQERMPKIPDGLAPERVAMLQQVFASNQRHLTALADRHDAELRQRCEQSAHDALAGIGASPGTLDAVIKALKEEHGG